MSIQTPFRHSPKRSNGVLRRFLLISPDEREYFVQEYSEKPLGRSSVITCMTTLNKKLKDDSSEQYLVLGTESKYIYIVDAVSNSTKAQVSQSKQRQIFLSGIKDDWRRLSISARRERFR